MPFLILEMINEDNLGILSSMKIESYNKKNYYVFYFE